MATQYTIEEIGARARQRQPELFKDFSDTEIGNRIIQRNPELQSLVSDVSDQNNKPQTSVPEDLLRFNIDVAKGVGKGALSTLKGASGLGERAAMSLFKTILPKAGERALGIEQAPTLGIFKPSTGETSASKLQRQIEASQGLTEGSLTTPTGTGQKLGFGAEQLGEFLIPGAASLKVGRTAAQAVKGGKLLKGATKVGATSLMEGLLGTGQSALQAGELGKEQLKTGALSLIAPPVVAGLSKTGKAVTKAFLPESVKFNTLVTDWVKTAFKPSTKSIKDPQYFSKAREAVQTIAEHKPLFEFTDVEGNLVNRLPQTRQETLEAVRKTKSALFNQYDEFTKVSGETGARVTTKPIADELRKAGGDTFLNLSNPSMAQSLLEEAKRYEQVGSLSVREAQDALQVLNSKLDNFYRNPDYNSATRAVQDAGIANILRKQLDSTVESLSGSGYKELKAKYGALKTIEDDVSRGAAVEARKANKGLLDFTDIFSGGQMVNGILTFNPASFAQGLTQKALATYYKHLNSPERAIRQMFEAAEKLPKREVIKPTQFKPSGLLGEGSLITPPPTSYEKPAKIIGGKGQASFNQGAVPQTALPKLSELPWDKKSKKEAGNMLQVLEGKKNSITITTKDGRIKFELGDKRFGGQKIKIKHLDNSLGQKEGAVTIQEVLSTPKVLKNIIGESDRERMKVYKVLSDDQKIIHYIEGISLNDAVRRFLNVYSNRNKKIP
mgnify:CR=1 FL=1